MRKHIFTENSLDTLGRKTIQCLDCSLKGGLTVASFYQ